MTNLWPNRLIGDEQYPDDCEWDGITLKRWPDWMVKGEPGRCRSGWLSPRGNIGTKTRRCSPRA